MNTRSTPRRLLAAFVLALAIGFVPSVATAQEYPPTTPATTVPETTTTVVVQGDQETATTTTLVEVAGDEVSTLPVTGGDVFGLLVIGLGAVAAGTVLVGVRRRAEAA